MKPLASKVPSSARSELELHSGRVGRMARLARDPTKYSPPEVNHEHDVSLYSGLLCALA